MQLSANLPRPMSSGWIYASLKIIDAQRELKPAEVSFDHIEFRTPPHLTSSTIEIIITNGDAEYRRTARVLPHDPAATEIPIELI